MSPGAGRPAAAVGHTVPALVLVAHGSSEPAAARTCRELRDAVAAHLPAADVTLTFLGHTPPHPAEALAAMPAGPAVLVPLLLATAYHVEVDLAAVADGARAAGRSVAVTESLMPHPLLLAVADDRLTERGITPDSALVLAAAGSTSASATAQTARFARTLAAHRDAPVVSGFAAGATPTVREAIALLRSGHRPVAVLTWLLAPGRFAAQIEADAQDGAVPYTGVLGAHPALARALVDRYATAGPPR